jgi:hypothetical protein
MRGAMACSSVQLAAAPTQLSARSALRGAAPFAHAVATPARAGGRTLRLVRRSASPPCRARAHRRRCVPPSPCGKRMHCRGG